MTRLPEPFDVCIAWVEFPDHPGIGKARPVIALATEEADVTVVAVKVTSHAPRDDFAGEVVLEDWQMEGLNVPSTARCSQVVAIALGSISKIIGRLSEADIRRVCDGLAEAGMLET